MLENKLELDFLSINTHLSSFKIYDLNIKTQQLQHGLLSLKHDIKREAEQTFDSKEVDRHEEGNEVNFDLPLKFDEFENEQEAIEEKKRRWVEKRMVLMS